MPKPKPAHAQPCQNCNHQDLHGEVSGCIALVSPQGARPAWCDCEAYVAPPTVGRTIPARATDPATSHLATESVKITARNQRGILLGAFAGTVAADAGGLTDEQAMEVSSGVSPYSEYAKRCSELRAAGLIQETGEARPGNAGRPRIVSAITEQGQTVLASLR